jgi:membrane protein required for colicin V production
MSKVDLTLSIIILVGAYSGFKDGFLVEVFSILAILLGILFGFKLMGWAMISLERNFHVDAKALPYIAFAAVFFLIVFVVNLLTRYLDRKVDHTFLGRVDQAVGGLLGLFRTAFMLSVFLWIFHSMKFELPEHWTEDSWVLPMVAELAPDIVHGLGKIIPFFRGVF